ncbi:MAG: hypothetical protein Kapaf2KO_18840 [Candidatus Kapaibacteriales bacterium]
MKKAIIFIVLAFAAPLFTVAQQTPQFDEDAVVDSLLTINRELREKFPRWKVCEPDLQFQIYQAFKVLKYPEDQLDLQNIEILAAPKKKRERYYDILLITSGTATMNARVIESQIKSLSKILSGRDKVYDPPTRGEVIDDERSYCFEEIPPERPPKPSEAEVIVNYLEPENKEQSIVLSLFEQRLKIGKTGFWLFNKVGNDQVGYPFWTAGENKVILKRPLYNDEPDQGRRFFDLISYHIGGAYRINAGEESDILSWLPSRQLNSEPNGKIIGGLDVHMPFEPDLGISLNLELPFQSANGTQIDDSDFVINGLGAGNTFDGRTFNFNGEGTELGVVPVLRGTGQLTAFYNLWLDKKLAENFFRFEAGVNYINVEEFVAVEEGEGANRAVFLRDMGSSTGVMSYASEDASDMLFAKVTYRNQSVYPFEVSTQISNSILMLDGYLPLFGNWLLLSAKYATPVLRDKRYFEFNNFFMISPIIRITL